MKGLLSTLMFLLGICPCLVAQQPITMVGHRGGKSLGPENTLSVLKKGMASGMQFLEIDIHQTADSVLVLSHDETLNRCTNGNGRIDDHTLEDIQLLDAGSWFSEDFANERVPTLDAALDLVNGNCGLWIEIKGNAKEYPGLERRLVELIQVHEAQAWVQVISFNTKALHRIHLMDSTIRLQKLLVSNMAAVPWYMDTRLHWGSIKKIDFVESYGMFSRSIHPRIIRKIHGWGKKVNAWTINQPARMERLKDLGIDGITTDYPDMLKKVLQAK